MLYLVQGNFRLNTSKINAIGIVYMAAPTCSIHPVRSFTIFPLSEHACGRHLLLQRCVVDNLLIAGSFILDVYLTILHTHITLLVQRLF